MIANKQKIYIIILSVTPFCIEEVKTKKEKTRSVYLACEKYTFSCVSKNDNFLVFFYPNFMVINFIKNDPMV
jgi:hypothetical protein